MRSSGTLVTSHVYDALKERLLNGAFRADERLDVAVLARLHGASTTPVREALTRLAAERLIAVEPKRGFFARLWSAQELQALYGWRAALLVRVARDSALGAHWSDESGMALPYVEAVQSTFRVLEARTNPEARWAAANADERLFRARRAEPDVLSARADLVTLIGALRSDSPARRIEAVRRYHAIRIELAVLIRDRAASSVSSRNEI